jgi:hypothetical protein
VHFFVEESNAYPVTQSPSQLPAPLLLHPEFVPVLAQFGSQTVTKQHTDRGHIRVQELEMGCNVFSSAMFPQSEFWKEDPMLGSL